MPRIFILTDLPRRFDETAYVLREFAAVWRRSGIEVEVGEETASPQAFDLAIAHIDLTFTPPEYLARLAQFSTVLNGRVHDISKRAISRDLVSRGDGYAGPVMIKTDRNCGGLMEAMQAERRGGRAWWRHALRQQLPWPWRSHLSEYPILPSASRVPRVVWHNRDLVVERFQPEKSGDFYCLRTWVFFGDKESNSISFSRSPAIKSYNVERREALADVPAELRQIRSRLGFDLGKFDYACVEGRIVLYDVNKTPTLGAANEQISRNMALLAEGIASYLT